MFDRLDDKARRALGMARTLGGIEIGVREGNGEWRASGTFDEAGPIASDVQVVPFEATGRGPLRVRLRQAKGHWRIDHPRPDNEKWLKMTVATHSEDGPQIEFRPVDASVLAPEKPRDYR